MVANVAANPDLVKTLFRTEQCAPELHLAVDIEDCDNLPQVGRQNIYIIEGLLVKAPSINKVKNNYNIRVSIVLLNEHNVLWSGCLDCLCYGF